MNHSVSPKRALQTATALLLGALATAPWVAQAQNKAPAVNISDGVVKMGLLLDMSSLYEEVTGMGTVTAVKMAIEDFGGKVHGMPIEVLYADHQNKADLAGSKAREWFDAQKVDMIGDVAASATALAAAEVARQKNKVIIMSGPGTSRLTNENCSPVSVHYAWDTYALSAVTGQIVRAHV